MSKPFRMLVIACVIFTTCSITSKLGKQYARLKAENDVAVMVLMNKYAPNPKYTIRQ